MALPGFASCINSPLTMTRERILLDNSFLGTTCEVQERDDANFVLRAANVARLICGLGFRSAFASCSKSGTPSHGLYRGRA
jgi:hypothetical protein